MTMGQKNIDEFDSAYRDRIHGALYKAIIEASRDSATNIAALRNHEIYDALMLLQAMFLSTSKEARSPTKIREISDNYAKLLRKRIKQFRAEYEKGNSPFNDVLHTDEIQ